jgi:hypothetical protein
MKAFQAARANGSKKDQTIKSTVPTARPTPDPLYLTPGAELVMRLLLKKPIKGYFGLEVAAATGLAHSTVQAILSTFAKSGWVAIRPAVSTGRGKPKSIYKLSKRGIELAATALPAT